MDEITAEENLFNELSSILKLYAINSSFIILLCSFYSNIMIGYVPKNVHFIHIRAKIKDILYKIKKLRNKNRCKYSKPYAD